jgi:hypothetical protein
LNSFENMNTNQLPRHRPTDCGRLRVFSLFLDFPGSIHSRWINSTISQLAGEQWITSTESWNLGSLTMNTSIRNIFTGEAAKADILTVTISSLGYRQHELFDWLGNLATFKNSREGNGMMFGYFGDDEHHQREMDWTVNQFQQSAVSLKREFAWQRMAANGGPDLLWLKSNLNGFLTRKLATQNSSPVIAAQPSLTKPCILPVLAGA